MQMSEADLGFEDTAEVGTGGGPIRAAIKNPPNELLPTRRRSSKGLLVCFVLSRPGKYERSAILKHGREIPTIYAQTVGWALVVRVKTQE